MEIVFQRKLGLEQSTTHNPQTFNECRSIKLCPSLKQRVLKMLSNDPNFEA
jgi:hypothetical protein